MGSGICLSGNLPAKYVVRVNKVRTQLGIRAVFKPFSRLAVGFGNAATALPDAQGVIETEDGAAIYFDHRGYVRSYPAGRRQILSIGTHMSNDDRYRWLNDSIAVGIGEVRPLEAAGVEIVLDWFEVAGSEISVV
jgi:hypothetical protein